MDAIIWACVGVAFCAWILRLAYAAGTKKGLMQANAAWEAYADKVREAMQELINDE